MTSPPRQRRPRQLQNDSEQSTSNLLPDSIPRSLSEGIPGSSSANSLDQPSGVQKGHPNMLDRRCRPHTLSHVQLLVHARLPMCKTFHFICVMHITNVTLCVHLICVMHKLAICRSPDSQMDLESYAQRQWWVRTRLVTSILVNMGNIMERADEQILPALYGFVAASFHIGPTQLGYLTLSRALVQAVASPLGGILGQSSRPITRKASFPSL